MSRNYTPAERALCLIGVLAGKSLKEINAQMDKSAPYSSYEEDKRKLNPRSYELLKTAYAPEMEKSLEEMWNHCVSPKSMSQLKKGSE